MTEKGDLIYSLVQSPLWSATFSQAEWTDATRWGGSLCPPFLRAWDVCPWHRSDSPPHEQVLGQVATPASATGSSSYLEPA